MGVYGKYESLITGTNYSTNTNNQRIIVFKVKKIGRRYC